MQSICEILDHHNNNIKSVKLFKKYDFVNKYKELDIRETI